MSIERPNLAGAFAPNTTRGAALTGLLPVQRPRPHPAPEPADTDQHPAPISQPDAQLEPAAPTASLATARRPSGARTPTKSAASTSTAGPNPRSDDASLVTNVAVYLEPDLLALARERRRTHNITYDELVVRAFDTIADDALIQALQPEHATAMSGKMPTRQRRVRGTAGIQVQIRLDTAQRRWLDEKQTRVAAPSRSALVALGLRLYLAG